MILSLSHKHDLANIDLKSADRIVYQLVIVFNFKKFNTIFQVKKIVTLIDTSQIRNLRSSIWRYRGVISANLYFSYPSCEIRRVSIRCDTEKNDLDDWKPRVSMISFDFFGKKKKRLCREDDQLNFFNELHDEIEWK